MKAKILVAEVPFAASLIDVLNDVLNDEAVCEARKCRDFNSRPTFTSTTRVSRFEAPSFSAPTTTCSCRTAPRPEWGIAGEPADEDKVFGACYKIDEPRIESYAFGDEWKFESDKEAFDRFVDAGEDCVARGLVRPEGVTEHRVQAIRKRIQDGPAFPHETGGRELIGESHIWR